MATYAPAVYISVENQTNYAFSFETIEQADVYVKVGENLTANFTITNYTTSGGGTVVLTTAPEVGTEVTVFRDTDITSMDATFVSGSAIRAQDLNGDFTQLRNAIQETESNVDSIIQNPYELPVASDVTLGGIKVGNNLSIDADGVLSSTGVPEAPNDGKQYGRQSEAWTEIAPPAASGVTKIVAGTNVTISPTSGEGEVTINSTATGGTGGATYKGTIDMTLAAPAAENGDFYVNTATSGTVNASWTGLGGTPLSGGERVIYNGGTNQWDMLPAENTSFWNRETLGNGSDFYLTPSVDINDIIGCGGTVTDPNIELKGFEPSISVKGTASGISNRIYNGTFTSNINSGNTQPLFVGKVNNSEVFQVDFDGGATCGGNVQIGGFDASSNDFTDEGAYIYANGQFRVNRTSDNARVFSAFQSGTQTVDIRSNGLATFSGNVGIGETNPSAKLDVNGTIRSSKITADTFDLDSLPALPA